MTSFTMRFEQLKKQKFTFDKFTFDLLIAHFTGQNIYTNFTS